MLKVQTPSFLPRLHHKIFRVRTQEALQGKKQGKISLIEEYIGNSREVDPRVPFYQLLVSNKLPGKDKSGIQSHTVLFDTGASASPIPRKVVDALNISYTPDPSVSV